MMKIYSKNILFIHHGTSIGGASHSLCDIIKRIDSIGCHITVIVPREGPFCDWLRDEGVKYKVIPLFIFYYCSHAKTSFSAKNIFRLIIKAVENIVYLANIIRVKDPDLIVLNSSTLVLCGVIARIMKKRVAWHIREIISVCESKILKRAIAAAIRFSADKVIVASNFSFHDMAKLKAKNIELIHNGIDLLRYHKRDTLAPERRRLGLGINDKVVGFIGHIYKEKGWRTLLEAAFILTEKFSDLRFVIVGSGYMIAKDGFKWRPPDKEKMEDIFFQKAVKEMRLDNNFIFLGQRFDVECILPAMDCVAFCSIAPETFGRVIAEAMASGIPVAASNIGATPELVLNKKTGLLFEAESPKSLVDALTTILTDRDMARRMGAEGCKRAKALFDIEKLMPQILEVYSAAL